MGSDGEADTHPGINVPQHLAIIMDGNGRWAKQLGKPRHAGHRAGVETVRTIVKAAREKGISFLTLYSFSTENWSRPQEEIGELFKLLRLFIRKDLAELHQNNVRVRVVGHRTGLPADVVDLLDEAENLTKNNTAQTVVLAFNYGSRSEITNAVRELADDVAAGRMTADQIDEAAISQKLFTSDIPDPDMILRTAGEMRLSNFLLWQAAYSEFVYSQVLWPDFSESDLDLALSDYAARKRKFGGLPDDKIESQKGTGKSARITGTR